MTNVWPVNLWVFLGVWNGMMIPNGFPQPNLSPWPPGDRIPADGTWSQEGGATKIDHRGILIDVFEQTKKMMCFFFPAKILSVLYNISVLFLGGEEEWWCFHPQLGVNPYSDTLCGSCLAPAILGYFCSTYVDFTREKSSLNGDVTHWWIVGEWVHCL